MGAYKLVVDVCLIDNHDLDVHILSTFESSIQCPLTAFDGLSDAEDLLDGGVRHAHGVLHETESDGTVNTSRNRNTRIWDIEIGERDS